MKTARCVPNSRILVAACDMPILRVISEIGNKAYSRPQDRDSLPFRSISVATLKERQTQSELRISNELGILQEIGAEQLVVV
jgi:hypothetical protein